MAVVWQYKSGFFTHLRKVTHYEMLFDRKLAKLYNTFSLLSKKEIHLTTKAVNHLDRATADLQPLVYTIIQISRYSNMLQMCRALGKCVPRLKSIFEVKRLPSG